MRSSIKKIYSILSVAVFILILVLFTVSLYFKISGKQVSVFGYTFSVVVSSSMDGQEQPVIKKGDFIAVKKTDIKKVAVGDVVLYPTKLQANLDNGIKNILHKVIAVNADENDEIYLTTKGTANPEPDREEVRQIIGVYKYKSAALGKFVLFYKNPVNIVFTIILITALYITAKLAISIIKTTRQNENRE